VRITSELPKHDFDKGENNSLTYFTSDGLLSSIERVNLFIAVYNNDVLLAVLQTKIVDLTQASGLIVGPTPLVIRYAPYTA
jgi:hypothetical protein